MYQLLLLCAVRFHCHVRALPAQRRADNNPAFFFSVVDRTIRFLGQTCERRCSQVGWGFEGRPEMCRGVCVCV